MEFPKPTRIVDPKVRARIKEGRCIICGCKGVDPDHIITKGAGGGDVPENLVPECRRHHNERHAKGWVWLLEKYPIARQAMSEKGWIIGEILGRKKLIRSSDDGSD